MATPCLSITYQEGAEDSDQFAAYICGEDGGLSDNLSGETVPFELDFRAEGAQVSLLITPEKPLRLLDIQLYYHHQFSETERVLFNGYQSWTDTHEVPALSALRGLVGTPQPVVDTWVVDASGDYRFTEYENRPGVRHGWTYAYFTARASAADESCLLFAGLAEQQGFTKVSMDAGMESITVQPEVPAAVLQAGQTVEVARFCVIEAASVDAAFEQWFALSDITARPAPLLAGYSSWYRRYEHISEAALLEDLAGVKALFDSLDTADVQRLFQIDDGYAKVGDWLQVDQEKFPQGLAPVAQQIKDAGFLPGLWMAPFVCERESELYFAHPEWIVRDAWGSPIRSGSHWSGQVPLDILNPEVETYVTTCIRMAVEDWGFGLLKLDFLYAACMVPHGGLNRGQLMARAVQIARKAAGSALLVGCGVPLAAAFGQFDYCRVGCDVTPQWDGPLYQRFIDRERVSSRNSVKNTIYRAPLCARAFMNDPDAVYISPVQMSEEQRKILLDAAVTFGGTLLTSDDVSLWDADQKAGYQQALLELSRTHEKRLKGLR